MLVCSLWTASTQKMIPSHRKRLRCDRSPLGFSATATTINSTNGSIARQLERDTACRLSRQTSAFFWENQDTFAMGTVCHFSQDTLSLGSEACCLKLKVVCHSSLPGPLGSRISQDTQFGWFDINLTAPSGGAGGTAGQKQAGFWSEEQVSGPGLTPRVFFLFSQANVFHPCSLQPRRAESLCSWPISCLSP